MCLLAQAMPRPVRSVAPTTISGSSLSAASNGRICIPARRLTWSRHISGCVPHPTTRSAQQRERQPSEWSTFIRTPRNDPHLSPLSLHSVALTQNRPRVLTTARRRRLWSICSRTLPVRQRSIRPHKRSLPDSSSNDALLQERSSILPWEQSINGSYERPQKQWLHDVLWSVSDRR